MRHLYPGASYPKETMRPELLLVDYKDEDLSEIIEDEDGDKVQIEAHFDCKPYQESDGKRHGD